MKRRVVIVSVNGRPSATSCAAVRAKLSRRLCRTRGTLASCIAAVWSSRSLPITCDCWKALAKNARIFTSYCGVCTHWSISPRRAPGSATTAATSSFEGARPTSSVFTLVTAAGTERAVKTGPASAPASAPASEAPASPGSSPPPSEPASTSPASAAPAPASPASAPASASPASSAPASAPPESGAPASELPASAAGAPASVPASVASGPTSSWPTHAVQRSAAHQRPSLVIERF